jgi:hypothetical protein
MCVASNVLRTIEPKKKIKIESWLLVLKVVPSCEQVAIN